VMPDFGTTKVVPCYKAIGRFKLAWNYSAIEDGKGETR
jgi:hypothetical protein